MIMKDIRLINNNYIEDLEVGLSIFIHHHIHQLII